MNHKEIKRQARSAIKDLKLYYIFAFFAALLIIIACTFLFKETGLIDGVFVVFVVGYYLLLRLMRYNITRFLKKHHNLDIYFPFEKSMILCIII